MQIHRDGMNVQRKAIVLLNRKSGSMSPQADGPLKGRLHNAFRDAGIDADIRVLVGEELGNQARQAVHRAADIVVAGGGDGTVSTVAGALAGTSRLLGVLPLGTRNHFARDLQLPLVLEEAVQVLVRGVVRRVDVGEVNGRVFINNTSLGIYSHIVLKRDEQQSRLGLNKWLALVPACLSALRRYPLVEVRLATGPENEYRKTPLLFVGNNRYETNLLAVRSRTVLDRGELCMYLVKGRGRFTLIRLALLALVGQLDQDRDFQGICLPEFRVDTPRRHLQVTVDGEVMRLRPPLQYRARPGDLRVLVPAGEEA